MILGSVLKKKIELGQDLAEAASLVNSIIYRL